MFWIFSLALAFLPFAFGRVTFEVGIVTLNPYIVGMCLVVFVAGVRWMIGLQKGFVGIQDVFILLLAATYLVSTMLADNIIDAGYLAFHALFIPIVSYFAVRIALQSNQQYEYALKLFVVSVFLFSVYFIITYFILETREKVLGIPPIGVATLTVSALMMAINMKDSRMIRWAGVVILVAFLLTFSRAYILILLFAPLLWKWVRKGRSAGIVIVFLLSTLLLTVVVSYEPEIFRPAQFDKSVEFSAKRLINMDFLLGTIYGRALSYRDGIDSFLESPIIGNGLFSGKYMVTQHNFHVEWLQYGGLIGYILYALTIIYHATRMRRLAQYDHWIAANIVVMILVLANSVTNGLMHGLMPYMFFLLMGLNEARLGIGKNAKQGFSSQNSRKKIHIESARILHSARSSQYQQNKIK